MNKPLPTPDQLQEVEDWIVKKREENQALREENRLTKISKKIVSNLVIIERNADEIALAEKWLAHERIKK